MTEEMPSYTMEEFKKKESEKHISRANWETTLSAILAGIIGILQFIVKGSFGSFNVGSIATLIIYLGLAVGVYFKSRVSSIILFVFFVSNIMLYNVIMKEARIGGLTLFFGICFFYTIVATFRYHSGKKYLAKKDKAPEKSLYEKIVSDTNTVSESNRSKSGGSKYKIFSE